MDFNEALLADALLSGAEVPMGAPGDDGSALAVETFDVDADGYDETRVTHTDAGITVATDSDLDGVTDKFTSVGGGGDYQSWEIFRAADGTSRWEQTASGELLD